MYKLVAVGGKLRGTEIQLNDGENVLGRAAECDHQVAVEGVSKKHMRITVNGDTAFVEDLGSSNGTFVNGKITKKITVKDGDKVALPNVIFQVVYVAEKKVIVKKVVAKTSDDGEVDLSIKEAEPTTLPGRILYIFRNKLMPVIYNFNEQYEWSVLFGILLFVFIAINIALTIFPVLRESKRLLVVEIAMRGKQYADEVARTNSVALSRRDLDKIDTNFLENSEGVNSYELFDLEGRIVRPISKLNTYVNDSFSVDALKFYKTDASNLRQTFINPLGDGQIGIARSILAYDVKTGREEAVGVIAIRFSPMSLAVEAANNSKAFLESLTTSAIVAVIFFGIIYYMTSRPLEEMRIQIEAVLRGKQKELSSKLLFKETNALRNSVNSVLQRLKELQNVDGGEVQELEEDGPYIRSLNEFMNGAQGPVMILSSEKNIEGLNTEGEDLLGIRFSASQGQGLLDTLREQGLAATIIDLCDQSANNSGVNQKETYEIQGKDMSVNVVGVMGKDKFAKAFYITFVKS